MKKLSKLLLTGAIALGLVACNNEDLPSGPDAEKGNTHVSVALSMSSSGFKSAVNADDKDFNYVGEWAGKDVIKTVSIYLVDPASTGPVTRRTFDVGDANSGKPYYITEQNGNTINILPNQQAAIKTTAGQKDVWVVVNENAVVQAHLATATAANFKEKYQDIALVLQNSGLEFNSTPATSATKLANLEEIENEKYDVIVMTNIAPKLEFDVAEGITAEATVGNDKPNRASLEVERAVARVLVTIKDDFKDIIKDANGNTIGTISNVKWVLAQGENSLFVQRKENWATPNFIWKPASDNDFYNDAGDKYDYSGLYEGYTAAPSFGGIALTDNPSNGEVSDENAGGIGLASVENGRFILATTHEYVKDDESSGYKKGNTAYVLVRALFTPEADAIVDGGTLTNGTFYLGANGKIYSSAAAAVDSENGGVTGQTVAKYVGGKVLYYAWVNPDEKPAWYNSPVLRNNIYHINITGFKNLGTNWNPLFPEDPDAFPPYIENPNYDPEKPTTPEINPPYIPNPKADPEDPEYDPDAPAIVPNPEYDPEKPTTPGENTPLVPNPETPKNPDPKPNVPGVEEPENPIDPKDPLTTPETWMSVDVKVLPWKVHSYELEF